MVKWGINTNCGRCITTVVLFIILILTTSTLVLLQLPKISGKKIGDVQIILSTLHGFSFLCVASYKFCYQSQVVATKICCWLHTNNLNIPYFKYRIFVTYNACYLFCQKVTVHKDQKSSFISNLKKPACASKQDMLELATFR